MHVNVTSPTVKEKGNACAHDADMRFKRTVYDASFGSRLLDKVGKPHVKAWRDGLKRVDGKEMSQALVNLTLASLKAALNLAVSDRLVAKSQAQEWKEVATYANASVRRDLHLDLTQRRALLAAASGAIKNLLEAAMMTGARAGELIDATRKQFDARTGSLTLTGKTDTRHVPLSPPALALFKRLAADKRKRVAQARG